MTAAWQSGIRTFRTGAAGIIRLLVIDPCDDAEILYAADTGDEFAEAAMEAAHNVLHQLRIPPHDRTPQGAPILCLTCYCHISQLERGILCCVAIPIVARPGDAFSGAICCKCAAHTDLLARAAVGFRSIWPDIQSIDVSADWGHASPAPSKSCGGDNTAAVYCWDFAKFYFPAVSLSTRSRSCGGRMHRGARHQRDPRCAMALHYELPTARSSKLN